jgi:leader peptidase (prepilin peptidase)/N-methyltransferase
MQSDSALFVTLQFGLLGLIVGSFLNVVIYRLPKMMERQWAADCAQLAGHTLPAAEPLNLMVPRSRCPHCNASIRWYDNIPLISYAFLRGHCRHCAAPIGLRYPAVELGTALLFAFCSLRWGDHAAAMVWCIWMAGMVCLALIDWDSTLLPDAILLPLLWLGLIGANLAWTAVSLENALWGAVAAYLSLWSVYWLFKLLTGKEGMGYGDFKLFACMGAWFGWQALLPIILIASLTGTVFGIYLKLNHGLREGGVIPFGPFLVGAAWGYLFARPLGFEIFMP